MNKLHLSAKAQEDLAKIKAYIAEELENPQAALSAVGKITKTIHMLRDYALIGAPLSSVANVKGEYRYLVSGNYIIFYRVNGTEVFVERVLYGRRDYLTVLFGDMPEDKNPR